MDRPSTREWWVGVTAGVALAVVVVAVTMGAPGLDEESGHHLDRAPGDPGETAVEYDGETVTSSAIEGAIIEALDEQRHVYGLDPLQENDTIASVARAHSQDMVEQSYVGHESPEGEDPMDRSTVVTDDCSLYGETIATTYLSVGENPTAVAEEVVDEWMDSPDHADTILEVDQSGGWDRAGVGVVLEEDGSVTVTANFCHRE